VLQRRAVRDADQTGRRCSTRSVSSRTGQSRSLIVATIVVAVITSVRSVRRSYLIRMADT
jgi:hypothetical protein